MHQSDKLVVHVPYVVHAIVLVRNLTCCRNIKQSAVLKILVLQSHAESQRQC